MKFYSVHSPLNRVALASILCITMTACGGGSTSDLSKEDSVGREQASASATWTTVASEGQSFTLASPKRVRYGAGFTWVSKYLSGTAYCGNSTFGIDPVPGAHKECRTRSMPSTSSATLTWTASTGADVSGYRIYYGTTPGSYTQAAGRGINTGAVTNYNVSGLNGATRYYFAVTSVDSSGNESLYSNEASKVVQ
jgi:Fibronectin type III domain